MKTDIPPVAHNTICVDFDGTIFQWGDIHAETPPFSGCIEVMWMFKEAGYRIVIFTSRMSPSWWRSEGWDFKEAEEREHAWVRNRLNEYNIPWDRITAEKVPAEYYVDDKALRFSGDWAEIAEYVLGTEGT